jgi:hypothetical protein
MDKSIIPEDCEVFGVYTNIIRIFFWQWSLFFPYPLK